MEKHSLEPRAKRARSRAVRPSSYLTRFWSLLPRVDSTSLHSISTGSLHIVLRQRANDGSSLSFLKAVAVSIAYQSINQELFSAHQAPKHRAKPQNLTETPPDLIFREVIIVPRVPRSAFRRQSISLGSRSFLPALHLSVPLAVRRVLIPSGKRCGTEHN